MTDAINATQYIWLYLNRGLRGILTRWMSMTPNHKKKAHMIAMLISLIPIKQKVLKILDYNI